MLNTITVGQLKQMLDDFNDDAKIVFADDYGDYCHTTQALTIQSVYSLKRDGQKLEKTAYSKSGYAIVNNYDDSDYDDEEDDDEEDQDENGENDDQVVVFQ